VRGTSAPSSEDNHICLKLTAIVELYCMFCKILDLWPAFQLYFPVYDKLTGSRFCARHYQERLLAEGGEDREADRYNNPPFWSTLTG
jgi:hypothetical protein